MKSERKKQKKIIFAYAHFLLALSLAVVLSSTAIFAIFFHSQATARHMKRMLADTFRAEEQEVVRVDCNIDTVKNHVYAAELLHVRKKRLLKPGDLATVKVFLKNTGNTPWFSDHSGCKDQPKIRLGTEKVRDRSSVFYLSVPGEVSGWSSPQRIALETPRVNPGEVGTFTFVSRMPEQADVYREFFAPVIEGVTWLNEPHISIDFRVGDLALSQEDETKLKYLHASAPLSMFKLDGEKSIVIDVSEQKMYVGVGDVVLYEFPVSSGKPSMPTPYGTTKILSKQQVRVAGKAPYYIMPKWLNFRKGGFGIHALPSIGNAKLRAKIRALPSDQEPPTEWFKNDALWTEALDHIGEPRSHGCVRLLPEHARVVFEFTEIGTPVTVRP